MESLISGTLAGMGSFRCEACGHTLTLASEETLPPCPSCEGHRFTRSSLFSGGVTSTQDTAAQPRATQAERAELVSAAASDLEHAGRYLVYRDHDTVNVVPLAREWTRIGRSLAADVRFDDPTVSRRHALIVRQADGMRVLDDRSLNGVFVNGERVEWRTLEDGDEIVVGRYHLHVVEIAGAQSQTGEVTTVDPLAALEAEA
jgi:pSer/pThr/pTyr-binding forkhead associated (FHA) protein